ncbi:small multidrug efflux protein [Promicromonospora soli]
MSGSNPYEWLQDLVAQVPEVVQPLIVALAGAIPYIEGEGSAALGVFAGIHPVVAGVAGAAGNIIAVVLVVLLSSRVRTAALARRTHRTSMAPAASSTAPTADPAFAVDEQAQRSERVEKQSKGRKRLRRWLVRFGVPGASLLGPLALPTHLTAATLVATGVSKGWVILWQVIAIVLWATLLTLAATGLVTAIEAA